MRRHFRMLPFLVAPSCLGLDCSNQSGPPAPDSCTAPAGVTVAAIEIGRSADPFVPIADGEVVTSEVGGQGFSMLPIRVRVRESGGADCLPIAVSILSPLGDIVASDGTSRKSYAAPDGSRATRPIYLVLGFGRSGGPYAVRVELGGRVVTRKVWLDRVDVEDGGGRD